MEQAGKIIQKKGLQVQQQQSCQGSLQRTSKNEQLVKILKQYKPGYQMEICSDTERCFFGNFPTLSELREGYGSNAAVVWVVPQLQNLAVYCGCREKLSEEQYKECAFVIATEFYYLKVSELMLFFHRFKSGRYGRFYGSVDPLVIVTALREFLRERGYEIDRHEQEMRDRRYEESLRRAVSREEYERMKEGRNI